MTNLYKNHAFIIPQTDKSDFETAGVWAVSRQLVIGFLAVIAFFVLASWQGALAQIISYGDGFEGRLYKTNVPLDFKAEDDREVRVSVRLGGEPQGFPSDLVSAFKSACDHHAEKLRRVASQLDDNGEWAVRVTFDWVVSEKNGVTITEGEGMRLHLDDCSPW